MIKCKNCQTDFEPKSPKAVYCSTRCRVAGNRNKKVNSIVTELEETSIVTTVKENMEETVRLNAEATEVLNANSLEDLKKKGIFTPNWRKTRG